VCFNHVLTLAPDFHHVLTLAPDFHHVLTLAPDFNHVLTLAPDFNHVLTLAAELNTKDAAQPDRDLLRVSIRLPGPPIPRQHYFLQAFR
jgi:hypothetical protein